ncbi:hypothetical protein EYC80_001847 [Monilinia laxa]|uniref:UBA domain-containing protein n=1 Tax=Monilinia laxa TaxID=61186 RepID=A0A5N6K675_MONLA|nr:hypothetical protein EYC80_001847 [Monilinia laxa]
MRAVKIKPQQSPISAQPYTSLDGPEANIQSPLSSNFQPSLVDQSERFYQKTASSSSSDKTVLARTANWNVISQELAEESDVPLYSQSNPPKDVEKWVEQVQVDRQDNELAEKFHQCRLNCDNSGSIFEWPWVLTELRGVRLFRQNSILEVLPKSDDGLSTSQILESTTHLRGGCIGWKTMHKSWERKRRIKKSQHHDCRNDIDLGYGGSHFFAQPFPKYDSTVDLMYPYETDKEKIQEIIHEISFMDIKSIKRLGSAFSNEIRRVRGSSSHPELDLQPGFDSTHTYLRGGMTQSADYSSSKSPSSECIRRRDKLRRMVKKPMKYMKSTRRKSNDKVQTPNEGNEETIEEFNSTEDDMTEESEWPGMLPLRNDETLTNLDRAIDYYNQHGKKVHSLQEKLDRIKTRLANAGIINEEYDDYFQDTQKLDMYEQMVHVLLRRNQFRELDDTLVFRCGAAAIGAAQILKRRIQQALLDEAQFPVFRQRGRHHESKHNKLLGAENSELEDDEAHVDEIDIMKEEDEWVDNDDNEMDGEQLWRRQLGRWSEADIYPSALSIYNHLREQVHDLKASLCKIEETVPKDSTIIQEYRGICQDTERLLDFELTEVNLQRELQKGTINVEERLRGMHCVCKYATRARTVLKKRINLVGGACQDEVKKNESKRNTFHRLKSNFSRHRRGKVVGKEKSRPLHSGGCRKVNDSSSVVTIEKLLEEYDGLKNLIRQLRLGEEIHVHDDAEMEKNSIFWKILEEQNKFEMFMRDIKYLRDNSRMPSILLASYGVLKAKQIKALIENNLDMAQATYYRLESHPVHQRGGAGSNRKRDKLRWKLGKLSLFVRRLGRQRRRSEGLEGGEPNKEILKRGRSAARRVGSSLSCLLTDYDRLSREFEELRRDERFLQDKGARIDEYSGYWTEMGMIQGHLEYRADIQARRDQNAVLSLPQVERGVSKAEYAKKVLQSKNHILRNNLSLSDEKSKWSSGNFRAGGFERKHDFLLWNFMQATQFLVDAWALKFPIAKEIYTSAKYINDSLIEEFDVILAPQFEPTNTQLRGGVGHDWKDFCVNQLAKIRRRNFTSERSSGGVERGENEERSSQRQAHQQHSRGDSGVSGVDITPSQSKDESVQKDPPQQANVSSQFSPELGSSRYNEDLDSYTAPAENRDTIAPVDPADPEEIEDRCRIERENIAWRQIQRRQELNGISDDFVLIMGEFIDLERVIRRSRRLLFCKRVANIGGRCLKVKTSRVRIHPKTVVTTSNVHHIKEFREGMLGMEGLYYYRVKDELDPNLTLLAKNYLIAARRTKEIMEKWLRDIELRDLEELSYLDEKMHAAGIFDNWPRLMDPMIIMSIDDQRETALMKSTLNPVQLHHGEERGESSRSSVPSIAQYDKDEESDAAQYHEDEESDTFSETNFPDPVDEILEQTTQLRIKNDLPLTVPTRNIPLRKVARRNRRSSSESEPLFMCYEEDAIPEEVMNHFLEMGHKREEIVFAFSASGGDPQEAARILSPEAFDESQIPTEIIDQLQGLGASRDEIVDALRSSHSNVNLAAEILFAERVDVLDQPFTLTDVHYLANTLQAPAAQAFEALVATGGDQTDAASRIFSGEIPEVRSISLGSMHHLVRLGATGRQAYDFLQTSRGDIQRAIGLFLEVERRGQQSFPIEDIDYFVGLGVSSVAAGNALAIAGGDIQHATEILLPLFTKGSSKNGNDDDDDDDDRHVLVSQLEVAEEDIYRLVDLGISRSEASHTLLDFQNDVEAAAKHLMSRLSQEEATEDGEAKNDEMKNDKMTNERNVPRNNTIDRKGKGRAF